MPCPADVTALAAYAVRVDTPLGKNLWLAPGLRHDPADAAPDVMRGEEIQIAGALVAQPAWAVRACIVLPGTHSKWVRLEDGRVVAFETHLTGELYAVLRQHSILGRLMPLPAKEAAARRRTRCCPSGRLRGWLCRRRAAVRPARSGISYSRRARSG